MNLASPREDGDLPPSATPVRPADQQPAGASPAGAGVEVRLDRLTKSFGLINAVDDISLTIPAGCFVTLLGPSGSGKTTTLNLIAGFLTPDRGNITFQGQVMEAVPPHRRNIGMVFQSYALFPHLTVFENVAYPLRMRDRLTRAAMSERVSETLSLVGLLGLEERYPRQLSGGQQQRVSMARALVSRPRLLLMDEPFGALDKKLREHLQLEVKQIHQRIGSTFICVTHDQTEALTMSDLVVVMHDARVAQVGSPRQVYEAPNSAFVADFLGGANLLRGNVMATHGEDYEVRLPNGCVVAVPRLDGSGSAGSPVTVFIRPEDIDIVFSGQDAQGRTTTTATVRDVLYMGESFKVTAMIGDQTVIARVSGAVAERVAIGGEIVLSWSKERSRSLPGAGSGGG